SRDPAAPCHADGERAGPGAWDMGCRSYRSGYYEPDLERAQVRGRAPHRGFGPRRGVAGRRRCSRPWDWDPGRGTEQDLWSVSTRPRCHTSRRTRAESLDGAADRAGERRPHQGGQPAGTRLNIHRGAAAMSASPRLPLMIVDDDDDLRDALADIMTAQGYEVAAFGDARAALTALEGGVTRWP